MSAITWDDVVALAPLLSTVDEDGQDIILAYVNEALDVRHFGGEAGTKTRLARIYLAAHFGTMSMPGAGGSAAGPVISESAGGLSITYANMVSGSGSGSLQRTSYGAMFQFLLDTSTARLPVVPLGRRF